LAIAIEIETWQAYRPDTAALKRPVETALPFHRTVRGFHAELRGLSQPLAQSTLEVFSLISTASALPTETTASRPDRRDRQVL
jgi:hypothetical protein